MFTGEFAAIGKAPLIPLPSRSPGLQVHPLGQAPASQGPVPFPAAHGEGRVAHDPLEEREHPILVVIFVHLVVREVRLREHASVLRVVPVDLDDRLEELLLGPVVVQGQEAPGVELQAHLRIAPVDRDAAGPHRVHQLLRGVPVDGLVLEAQVELVLPEEVVLGLRTRGDHPPDVVQPFAPGVHGLVPVQPTEEIEPPAGALRIGVRNDEGAELPSGRRDGLHLPRRLEQLLRATAGADHVIGEAEVPQVVDVVAGHRVVADREVGPYRFARPEELLACVQSVEVALLGVDDEVRPVVDFDAVLPGQDPRQEVVVLVDPVEVAEVQANCRFCVHGDPAASLFARCQVPRKSAILPAAFPSPYGLCAALMARYASGSSRSRRVSATIFPRSVPTSRAAPAWTASGRSVASRITRTGFPREGASSCTPPESVMMMRDRLIRYTNGRYSTGSTRWTFPSIPVPRMRRTGPWTLGFRWTG